MADFFKELERTFTEVVDVIGKKTEDTVEIQKLKMDVRSMNRANDRDYMEIGKKIYARFLQGEVSDAEFTSLCQNIESRADEIAKKEDEIRKIQGV